jgi:hypothetical protein
VVQTFPIISRIFVLGRTRLFPWLELHPSQRTNVTFSRFETLHVSVPGISFFGISSAFVLMQSGVSNKNISVIRTFVFFLLLSSSAAQKLPYYRIPDTGYSSFLPEDLGTLGALNQNETELQAKWNDFLSELQEDQEVASLTEAEIHIDAI